MDRMAHLLSRGGNLHQAMSGAKEALENLAMDELTWNPKASSLVWESSPLRHRFESCRDGLRSSGVLRPRNYFTVNRATVLTLFAVVFTYIIILLQFKQNNF